MVLSNILKGIGPSVIIPNGATIASTKTGILPLSRHLITDGATAKILPGLSSASLVSLEKLCDDDCKVFLDKNILIAVKEENNYRLPSSHPSSYPQSEKTSSKHIAQAMFVPNTKKKKHRLHKILRRLQFDELIQDNIDNYQIDQQLKQDTKQYCL